MHPLFVIGSCSSEGPNLLLLVIGDLGDRGVSFGACQIGCGSPKKKFVRGLSSTTPEMLNGDS